MTCFGKLSVVFLLTLACQLSFGQTDYLNEDQTATNSELRQNLQGEWLLSETEVVDGYGFFGDTNGFISNHTDSRRIIFKSDSVEVHPVQGKRYYTGCVHDYQFEIQYDTLFSSNDISLYEGRRRKRQMVETYEVIKCDRNELILKSYRWLRDGLDLSDFSVFYIYRREGVDSLFNQLFGEWTNCSKENQPFLFDTDSSEFTLVRSEESASCNEYDDRFISLNFLRNRRENLCQYYSYSGVIGGGAEFTIEVDPANQLIYFGNKEVLVYHIVTLTENELILSFNPEKTVALRKASE